MVFQLKRLNSWFTNLHLGTYRYFFGFASTVLLESQKNLNRYECNMTDGDKFLRLIVHVEKSLFTGIMYKCYF